jgi:arylsulfatase A-like enzyme
MKRLWIVLAVLAVIGVGGYLAFERYKFYLPGIIANLRDPIAANHPVEWAQGPAEAPTGQRPPNIILIVADDLGYNDVSFNGGGMIPTPNIDALGREGVSVDQGYAANATCSPSRAAMMTGRYPTRFGFEFTAVPAALARNIAHFDSDAMHRPIYHSEAEANLPPVPEMGVPASEITVAEALRERGYHTVHIGKWHLGEAPALRPEAQGFAESLGFMAGGGLFLPERDPNVVNAKLPFDPIDQFLWPNLPYAVQFNGGQRFAPDGYVTDYFSNEAVRVIEANRNRPFFLYLAYNAPHTPLQATRADYEAVAHIPDHTRRVYAAMLLALDRGVGQVMQALRDNGLDQNTLVIFTSDNGGAWYTGLDGLNAPFRGWKATFFEGGVRVPFFARWPGGLPAGQRIAGPAGHLDVFATAVAAAGGAPPSDRTIDSVNLLPFMRGETLGPPHEAMFWRSGHYRVVRVGDWKLQVAARPERTWLFNLADDPQERRDLSAQEPERVAQMRAMIEAHERDMPAPLWPALLEGPVRIDVHLNTPWREDQEYVYWAN